MLMEAKQVGVAQNAIKWKPKEKFRNVSVLMPCACQQAEPILMSTTPRCKSQQRITGSATRSTSPFRQTAPARVWCWSAQNDCRDGCRSIPEAASDSPQLQLQELCQENHQPQSGWMLQAPRLPASDPCISCSPVAPNPQGTLQESNPKLGTGSQKQLSFCYFLLFLNVLENVDWLFAAWLHLHQTHPLDLLQTVLLWGMNEMYLFGSSSNMGGNC